MPRTAELHQRAGSTFYRSRECWSRAKRRVKARWLESNARVNQNVHEPQRRTWLKRARDWNWGIAVGYLLIVMNIGLSLSLVYSYVPPVSNGPNLTCAFPGGSLTAPWLGVPWHLVLVQLHRVSHLQTDTRGRCWVAAQRVGETYQWLLYYWSHQHH